MKIVLIVSLSFFSLILISMEPLKSRKRRTELESLVGQETSVDKFLCVYNCGYVNTYKAVQAHERTEHGVYKVKKRAVEQAAAMCNATEVSALAPQKAVVNYDSVKQETNLNSTASMILSETMKYAPVEKEPTMQPPTPEKKIVLIPDTPFRVRSFDRHVFTAEDSIQMSLAPLIMLQTMYERNSEKRQSRLKKQEKADDNIPTSWNCPICFITFEAKNRYFCHLIMMHNYQFPEYAKDKAYFKRIQRLMDTPYNEPLVID